MTSANVHLMNSNSVPTFQTPLSSVPSRLTQTECTSSSVLQVDPEHVINFDGIFLLVYNIYFSSKRILCIQHGGFKE